MGRSDDDRAARWAERQRKRTGSERAVRGAWQDQLRKVGLGIDSSNPNHLQASGTRKGTRLGVVGTRSDGRWTFVLQAHNKHIDPAVSLQPEAGVPWLAGLLRGPEHVVGDPALDDAARIHGPADQLLATLTAGTRSRLVRLISQGGAVGERTVQRTVETEHARPRSLPAQVAELTDLAQRLGIHPRKLVGALIRTAREDPLPGLQTRALLALLTDHPDQVPPNLLTEPAVLAILDDLPNPGLAVALAGLADSGTSLSLPRIAPLTRFPRGNNATRKAAKRAAKAIAERTAPEGGLVVVSGEPAPVGQLAVARETGGGLSEPRD